MQRNRPQNSYLEVDEDLGTKKLKDPQNLMPELVPPLKDACFMNLRYVRHLGLDLLTFHFLSSCMFGLRVTRCSVDRTAVEMGRSVKRLSTCRKSFDFVLRLTYTFQNSS